ncbi:MAG: hypothetical protein ACE5EE_09370 [Fidelibacterota bacterium]
MSDIIVFVQSFRLGTQIAEVLARFEFSVDFPETVEALVAEVSNNTRLIILDLDEEKEANFELIAQIRKIAPDVPIAGFLAQIRKADHDAAKVAGCHWIFTRSSFVQNLKSLLIHGLPEQE